VGIGVPQEHLGDEGIGRFDDERKRPKVRGIRRDPLGVRKNVLITGDREGWSVAEGKTKGAVRPSEFNHGNIPFDSANTGVTVEYAEQIVTLSLIALRRLRFPTDGNGSDPERDAAARTVLAALGLCAATLAFEDGFDLRSRCVLWPESPLEWELLATPGAEPEKFSLNGDQAAELLAEAAERASSAGVEWRTEPLILSPSDALLDLVRRSQETAVKEGGDSD
jgi:CRISPR-associated protein Csb1